MALYIPVRPRWNPRGEVVNYVSHGRLCARGWPAKYRDANSASQRKQRGKMAQVCDALPYLKALLAEGYSPVVKRNGRRVGAYHAAVSVALREWFGATPGGPRLDRVKIRLTDGARALPEALVAARAGSDVRVAWRKAIQWRGAKLLFAARLARAPEWVCAPVALAVGAVGANLALPAHWAKDPVEVWLAFVGAGGRVKTHTLYRVLRPAAASSPPKRGKNIAVSVCRLARKGPIDARKRSLTRAAKRPANACKFGLRGHSCLVKKGTTG